MQFITDNFSNVKKDLLRSLIAIKYSNNIDKITDAYRTMVFFQDDITIESSIIPSIARKTQDINHYISNMRQKELNNYSKISPLVKNLLEDQIAFLTPFIKVQKQSPIKLFLPPLFIKYCQSIIKK